MTESRCPVYLNGEHSYDQRHEIPITIAVKCQCGKELPIARSPYDELEQLRTVALEAAIMLAETNHGGLTHARSESMRKALEKAGVEIPRQCADCPEHANMRPAK